MPTPHKKHNCVKQHNHLEHNPRVKIAYRTVALLAACFLVISPVTRAQGRDDKSLFLPDVIVDLGKPNVWTMDQAHYLLERNRARDLGLQAADPSPLDPNDVSGIRLSSIRSMLSGQVSYDASIGANNKAKLTQYNGDLQRYDSLRNQRDGIRLRQQALQSQLSVADANLILVQNLTPADPTKLAEANAQIKRLTDQKTAVDSEYAQITTEMGTEPTAPTIAAGNASDENTQSVLGTDNDFESLLKLYATGAGATKIAASIRLDNYVNLQYELVAKQLTLLRDQAGPDNKVLFLELPQSIYVTNKLRVYPYLGGWWGAHVLQTWWRLDEALLAEPPPPSAEDRGADNRPPTRRELLYLDEQYAKFFQVPSDETDAYKVVEPKDSSTKEYLQYLTNLRSKLNDNCPANYFALESFFSPNNACGQNYSYFAKSLKARELIAEDARPKGHDSAIVKEHFLSASSSVDPANGKSGTSKAATSAAPENVKTRNPCSSTGQNSTSEVASSSQFCDWANKWNFSLLLSPQHRSNQLDQDHRSHDAFLSSPAEPEPMYALDLIPRQSALNVADANVTSHSYGFTGLFSLLSGIGAKTRYERQQNQFSQFIQQETYASAFGKGEFEFGWTFGPLPGTNRLAPGLRTTYAIVVVPKATRFVRLYGIGCGYRRRNVPYNPFIETLEQNKDLVQHKFHDEQCSSQSIFDIEVPSSEDDFHVDNIHYESVASGQRVTVEIDGRFGEQIGLLINGTPLQKVPSIGQPMLLTSSFAIPANAGDTAVQGVYELVHGKQIVASFIMPTTFAGTPKITLITAGREGLLNEYKIWPELGTQNLVKGPNARSMFTQPATISRVETIYDSQQPSMATIKIVGKGFTEAKEHTLLIGPDFLKPQTDGTAPITKGEYKRLSNGILIAAIDRDKYFPHWSLDYLTVEGEQTNDAPFVFDDDMPPAPSACKYSSETKDDKTTVTVTLTGKYFTSAYAPSKISDNLKMTSVTLVSPTEWDIIADASTGWQTSGFALKGPKGSPMVKIASCSAPPVKKAPVKVIPKPKIGTPTISKVP